MNESRFKQFHSHSSSLGDRVHISSTISPIVASGARGRGRLPRPVTAIAVSTHSPDDAMIKRLERLVIACQYDGLPHNCRECRITTCEVCMRDNRGGQYGCQCSWRDLAARFQRGLEEIPSVVRIGGARNEMYAGDGWDVGLDPGSFDTSPSVVTPASNPVAQGRSGIMGYLIGDAPLNGVADLTEEMRDTLSQIREVTGEARFAIKNFTEGKMHPPDSFEKLMGVAEANLVTLSNAAQGSFATFNGFLGIVMVAVVTFLAVKLLIDFIRACMAKRESVKPKCMVMTGVHNQIIGDSTEDDWSSYQPDEEQVAGIFSRIKGWITMIDGLIRAPLKFLSFLSHAEKSITLFFRRMTFLKQGIQSIEWLVEKSAGVIEMFLSWVTGETVRLTRNSVEKHNRNLAATHAISNLQLMTGYGVQNLAESRCRKAAFTSAYLTCLEYSNTYSICEDNITKDFVRSCDEQLRRHAPLYREMYEVEDTISKYHPCWIYLTGSWGVGKSFVVDEIVDYVCKRLAEDDFGEIPRTKRLYPRNQADEFYSRYNNQFFCLFDDFAQGSNSPDLLNMVSLVTDLAVPLNMASIEEKGKYFSSRVIISTSNTPYPTGTNITEASALHRRRDWMIRVETNGEEITGTDGRIRRTGADDELLFTRMKPLGAETGGNEDMEEVYTSRKQFLEATYQMLLEHHRNHYGSGRRKNQFNLVPGWQDPLDGISGLVVEDPQEKGKYYIPLAMEGTITPQTGESVVVYGEISGAKTPLDIILRRDTPKLTLRTLLEKRLADVPVVDMQECLYPYEPQKAPAWISSLEGWVPVIRLATEVGLTAICVHKIYKYFFGDEKVINESDPGGKKQKVHTHKGHTLSQRPVRIVSVPAAHNEGMPPILSEKIRLELGMNHNAYAVAKIVISNQVTITTEYSGIESARAYGLFICGHNLLMNHHVYLALVAEERRGSKVRVYGYGNKAEKWQVRITGRTTDKISQSDAVVVNLGVPDLPHFRDIRKHFVGNDVFETRDYLLVAYCHGGDMHFMGNAPGRLYGADESILPIQTEANEKLGIDPYYAVKFNFRHKDGDCGLAVFVTDRSGQFKVIGIHSMGGNSTDLSIATLVTRDGLACDGIFPPTEELVNEMAPLYKPPEQLHVVGSVPNSKFIVRTNPQSGWERSCFYGKFHPPMTDLSVKSLGDSLRRGNGQDPLFVGQSKYGVDLPVLDDTIYYQAVDDVAQDLISDGNCELYARKLSYYEVLNGTKKMPYCYAANLRTSPGWPWKCMGPKKSWLLRDGDGEICFTDKKNELTGKTLYETVTQNEDLARNGIRPEVYYMDCCKDECRPIEKIKQSKTRIFTAISLDHYILARRYYAGFISYLMKNRITNGCGPGMVESGVDWFILANLLREYDAHVVGDVRGWDGTLHALFMMAFPDCANQFYRFGCDWEAEDDLVRSVITYCDTYAFVVAMDAIYLKALGQVSGGVNTAPGNTLSHRVLFRYLWIFFTTLSKRLDLLPMGVMKHYIHFIAYGDDNIISLRMCITTFVNQEILTKWFASIGVEYTDITKDGRKILYRPFDEVSFCKRKFVHCEGAWLGVRELEDILETLYFVTRGREKVTFLKALVDSVLRELWRYGPEIYDDYSEKIKSIMAQEGIVYPTPSYEMLKGLWLASLGVGGSRPSEDPEEVRIEDIQKQRFRADMFSQGRQTSFLKVSGFRNEMLPGDQQRNMFEKNLVFLRKYLEHVELHGVCDKKRTAEGDGAIYQTWFTLQYERPERARVMTGWAFRAQWAEVIEQAKCSGQILTLAGVREQYLRDRHRDYCDEWETVSLRDARLAEMKVAQLTQEMGNRNQEHGRQLVDIRAEICRLLEENKQLRKEMGNIGSSECMAMAKYQRAEMLHLREMERLRKECDEIRKLREFGISIYGEEATNMLVPEARDMPCVHVTGVHNEMSDPIVGGVISSLQSVKQRLVHDEMEVTKLALREVGPVKSKVLECKQHLEQAMVALDKSISDLISITKEEVVDSEIEQLTQKLAILKAGRNIQEQPSGASGVRNEIAPVPDSGKSKDDPWGATQWSDDSTTSKDPSAFWKDLMGEDWTRQAFTEIQSDPISRNESGLAANWEDLFRPTPGEKTVMLVKDGIPIEVTKTQYKALKLAGELETNGVDVPPEFKLWAERTFPSRADKKVVAGKKLQTMDGL